MSSSSEESPPARAKSSASSTAMIASRVCLPESECYGYWSRTKLVSFGKSDSNKKMEAKTMNEKLHGR